VRPLLDEAGIAAPEQSDARAEWLARLLDSVKLRAKTLPEMVQRARLFFPGPVQYEPDAVAKHWKDRPAAAERLRRLRAAPEDLTDWGEAALEAQLLASAELMGIGAGKLIRPLRLALSGSALSPGIFEVMHLLGRELVLRRIDDAIAHRSDA
jgi:glutamyl-tRNA synthetase